MKIKNYETLATTPLRRSILEIVEKGLQSIDTIEVLTKSLKIDGNAISVFGKNFALNPKGKLIAICIGKCAGQSAYAFEKVLGDKLLSGVALGVNDFEDTIKEVSAENKGAEIKLQKIKYYAGTHPMPSEANVVGSRAILNSLNGLSEDDTVLFLISGGGSTLLAQPPCITDKVSEMVAKEKDMLSALFRAGATIQEINTVRKHMSLARGGFLASTAHPAQVISIIFSDVPGSELGFISSGPTVKDETTVADAENIVKKYNLDLTAECFTETPKDDSYFRKVYNILTVSNEFALFQMKKVGEELGFKVEIKNTCVVGEARTIGESIADEVNAAPSKTVLLYCGETTVTIKGHGKGGRNQELVLAALPKVDADSVVISIASDGHDNGPHAGAIADQEIFALAKEKQLDSQSFLDENNSSAFFEAVGGLIETGDTGSNVSDLIVAVKR